MHGDGDPEIAGFDDREMQRSSSRGKSVLPVLNAGQTLEAR